MYFWYSLTVLHWIHGYGLEKPIHWTYLFWENYNWKAYKKSKLDHLNILINEMNFMLLQHLCNKQVSFMQRMNHFLYKEIRADNKTSVFVSVQKKVAIHFWKLQWRIHYIHDSLYTCKELIKWGTSNCESVSSGFCN